MRLLLADSSDRQRRFFTWLLREFQGVEVFEANSGAAALTLLQHEPFDLLLLEPRLPDMDGLALIGAAFNGARQPTRVLIVSRHADEVYKRKARSLGVDEYLTKPASAICVRNAVRTLLHLPDALPPPGADKRRSARLGAPANVTLQLGDQALCTTADIGVFGAFVMSERPLTRGTAGSLTLSLPHLEAPLYLNFEVVHARTRPVGDLPAGFGVRFKDTVHVRKLTAALSTVD